MGLAENMAQNTGWIHSSERGALLPLGLQYQVHISGGNGGWKADPALFMVSGGSF